MADGRQAYWVCPLVDESEAIDLTAAEDRLAKAHPHSPVTGVVEKRHRVGILHVVAPVEEVSLRGLGGLRQRLVETPPGMWFVNVLDAPRVVGRFEPRSLAWLGLTSVNGLAVLLAFLVYVGLAFRLTWTSRGVESEHLEDVRLRHPETAP